MRISADGAQAVARRGPAILPWPDDALRYFLRLAVILLTVLGGFIALSLYEWAVLGERSLGVTQAPYVTPYYLGRLLPALLFALLIAVTLYRGRHPAAAIHRAGLSSRQRKTICGLAAALAGGVVLFVADPALFGALAKEDRIVEWLSALLPLSASAAFVYAWITVKKSARRDTRRRIALAACPLFAFGLFVIGMEEISWMQRIFGVATPPAFAQNQQGETNLHNFHSIIFDQTYRAAAFAFFVLLPFVVETAPRIKPLDLAADFVPSRFALAATAPFAAFHYDEWNFFASPVIAMTAALILAGYAKAAWARRDGGETAIFGGLLVIALVTQPLFLALGHRFVRHWDASEYMELILAAGWAVFALEAARKLIARYGQAQTASR